MEVNQGSEAGKEGVEVKVNEVSVVGSIDGVGDGNARGGKLGDCDETEVIKGDGIVCVDQESVDGDGDGEDVVERHKDEFLVGDLVWGKIRSHPWWPGVIYDPSDASDFALKFKKGKKLLVAYFGDGSCAWCSGSQLVPFVEHYEKMSKQSSSKSFVCAVEEALVELGRRVELKLVCSCVPEGNLNDLSRPESTNAGVRSGVLMPNGSIDKLPSPWSEPALLLEYVRNLKEAGPVSNSLERVLIKSWLSAFSRVKRGCCLPIYREPQLIEGLEDKSKNAIPESNDFSVPIAVPIQGPSEEECDGSPKTLPVKGLMVTSTQKRKQKSVAELMIESKGVKVKEKKIDNSVSRTDVVNDGLPNRVEDEGLRSIKQKQDEDSVQDDINSSTAGRKRGRKRADRVVDEGLRSIKRKQDEDTVQNDINASTPGRKRGRKKADRVENESTQLNELKKSKDPVDDVDGDSDEKTTLKRFISRERKSSKYLSAPYTIPSPKLWRSNSRRELETKSDKIASMSKVGERLSKVAGQLISSPRLTQGDNAVSEGKMSGDSLKLGTNITSSQTMSEKMTDNCSVDISASADQVCAEVLSAGVDIMSMDRSSIEPLKAFISAFRSAKYHDQNSGKKMNSSSSEARDTGNDINNAVVVSAQPAANNGKTEKARSRVTKLKKAARAAAGIKKEADKTSPDALIISFGCDASLPSKDEIIMKFNKFGSINEEETKLLHDSNCAQVVYNSTSNAELAFKESIKQSPFSGNHVEYNLQYSSDASRALAPGKTSSKSPRKRSPKKPVSLQPTGGDISQVNLVRQNLASVTSMVNQCNFKISAEEKSSLEDEILGLLQKVGELEVKTSS